MYDLGNLFLLRNPVQRQQGAHIISRSFLATTFYILLPESNASTSGSRSY